MARILFTWELGGGLGHSLHHRPLLEALTAAGYEIWFAMRNLEQAERLFAGLDIHYLPAPVNIHNNKDPVDPVLSHAHLLHNVIFHSVDNMLTTTSSWQEIFAQVKPDLMIADHSPGALFASRGLPFVRMQIGTGFTIPPNDIQPMPNLRNWLVVDNARLAEDEKKVLDRLNKVAEIMNLPALSSLAELYQSDGQYLMTFKELDHMTERSGTQYYGVSQTSYGDAPVWPGRTGKRIFAYLKPFKTLPSLLATLKAVGTPTLIYYAGEMTEELKAFESEGLKFAEQMLDISQVAKQCDVAITHAGHGAAVEFLLAGCPLLLLPLQLEQYLLSLRVQALGAGLTAPFLKPEGMAGKLRLLLTDPAYTLAAEAFSSSYKDFDSREMITRLVEDIHARTNEVTGAVNQES